MTTTKVPAALAILMVSLYLCGFTAAQFDRRKANIERRLRDAGITESFHIFVETPFVVIGDGSRRQVRRRAEGTVRWAINRLKDAFFSRDLRAIHEIWLFKDEASYETHSRLLFGDDPDTPYGYYSQADRALIMNIGTGGGTLVHELVHPYVAANFPAAPPWLDEGLGSLYEHSGDDGGQIVGYLNWRLPILKRAIRAGKLPSFRTLMSASSHGFYDQDPGSNYAQARYLLYYLQDQGLLRRYYRRFYNNHAADPSGYKTLAKVLGDDDIAAFQKQWERWVLTLRRTPNG